MFKHLKSPMLLILLLFSIKVSAQNFTLTGKVVNAQGEPVIGASVVEKSNPKNGTVTNLDGKFSLLLPSKSSLIGVTFIGMKPKNVTVSGKTNDIVVMLQDADVSLNDVLVIGYGSMKKRDVTGAITSIKSNDIMAIPTSNVLKTLQGKIAGLDVQQSSGQPGSSVTLTLRGNRSLNADNKPLVLVDGIEYGQSIDLDPSDIASIEVLKDISSTAIYGTRGANGVIIVTTKNGSLNSKTKISVNSYLSIKNKSEYPHMMNGEQYAQLKREAYRTTNVAEKDAYRSDSDIFNAEELEYLKDGYSVDWQSLLLHTGITQNYNVNISGGNAKTAFCISLGFQEDQGLLKNDNLRRYDGRISLDHHINKIFTVGINSFYTYRDQNKRYNPMNMANKIPPIAKAYDDKGNININPAPGYSSMYSPLVDEVSGVWKDNVRSNRLFMTGYVNAEFIKNLVFKSDIGIDINNSREGEFADKNTLTNLGVHTTSSIENQNSYKYTWENTLTYNKKFGKHEFTGLLGSSLSAYNYEDASGGGQNQASATTGFYDLGSNSSSITISSSLIENQLESYFGRLNYKYNDRYLFQASLRADGSSVLAKGHKWGYFPSLSAAWRMSEESFLKNVSFLDNLKLRLSWGIAGNSAINAYETLGGLSQSVYAFGESVAYGYYPSSIANPDLKWEKTATYNVGIDFGLLKNRISGSIDAYISHTSDLLLPSSLPTSTGFSSVMENVGKTQNRGIELTLSTNWIKTRNFNWVTDWTYAKNKEKIVALNNGVTRNEANCWFVGKPTSVFYDYKKIGIWQLGQEDAATKFGGFKPGDIKVADVNKDGVYDTDDRVVYSRVPKFIFGINNTLTYKDFDLSCFVYGRIGQYIKYEYNLLYKPSALENSAPVNYWTPENPSNDFPRPNSSYSTTNYLLQSCLAYVKSSYVKIRDITLGYTLPSSISKKVDLQKLRVYITMNNYFTFCNLHHYDPENSGSMSFPLAKQLVFGLNIDL